MGQMLPNMEVLLKLLMVCLLIWKERVINTPICESAVVSAGMGLSINGYKAIVEMQFADFRLVLTRL
jgi:transketolase C-terminal domain/subunit